MFPAWNNFLHTELESRKNNQNCSVALNLNELQGKVLFSNAKLEEC